jgi:hypothetical protein
MPDHPPPEPTSAQCSDTTELTWPGDDDTKRRGTACWYPSMGGYAAKAVAVVDQGMCINVYVWHNGEFPFTDDDTDPRPPRVLHHCDGDGFVRFGEFLNGLTNFQ